MLINMFTLHPQLAKDCISLGNLTVCQVLLLNDSQYPWVILVPRRDNITELYQLNKDDLAQCQAESITMSKLLMAHFNGDKLNTGALGNLVPQCHLHHIVRFKTDAAWPKPVWGAVPPVPYTKEALAQLTSELRTAINAAFADLQEFV